jgi:hypothetical protein
MEGGTAPKPTPLGGMGGKPINMPRVQPMPLPSANSNQVHA